LAQSIEVAAYPNPFNEAITLSFRIPSAKIAHISLAIYNSLGQKVKDLTINESAAHQVIWQASDGPCPVASGVYFAVLSSPNWKRSVKILLLK